MSQDSEEQKDVPTANAAAPTTGESQPNADDQDQHQHIDDHKKRKLLRAVKMGLSIGCAGRIAVMSTPSANLILKNYKQTKRQKISEEKTGLPPEPNSEKDLANKAKLECTLDVMQAREIGDIGKTNILKMDNKVNKSIRKILEKDVPKYELTLADKVKNSDHQLPQPGHHAVRPMGPQGPVPSDQAHWKSLPMDVKKHELKRMHAFLFNTTSEFETEREKFLPRPFFPEIKKNKTARQ